MGRGRNTFSFRYKIFAEQYRNQPSQGCLFALLLLPLCRVLHGGDGSGGGGGGGGGIIISNWAVKAENSTNLGPSPPFLLCVSCVFLFLSAFLLIFP